MSAYIAKAPATKEALLSQLKEQIIKGRLAVGEKLPTERELEQRIGIGKSAVHGVLTDLEHKGFITIVPRKGAYVADFAKKGSAETLSEVLRINGGRLSFKMSVEIVELRNAIEGGALIRLAERHTDADITKLRQALDELRRVDVETLEVPDMAAMESRFHTLICELSGNDLFSLVMSSFAPMSVAIWQNCALYWGVEGFIKHDEILIGMIERGEGHEAQMYIEGIFAQFLEAFFRNK